MDPASNLWNSDENTPQEEAKCLLTFDLLVFFVPASKLLAFDSGYVGIVGTIYNGGYHTLKEKKKKLRSQETLDGSSFSV